MAQHFLLSSQARTLSLKQVFQMSDQECRYQLARLRWPYTEGQPVCLHCGKTEKHYWIKTQSRWKCAKCRKNFSITSGTIFADHKLPLKDYLAAILLSCNSVKNLSSLQLARDLSVQYKTAFVLQHKIREAIDLQQSQVLLKGQVELDGCYTGGYLKPLNEAVERVDRRLVANKTDKKRCILVMMQRNDQQPGANVTRTFVIPEEDGRIIKSLAIANIDPTATVYTDEHRGYIPLAGSFDTEQVNHSERYSDLSGTHINNTESYNSRFKRAKMGQHHKIMIKYLDRYATEVAYRDDNRDKDNGFMFMDLLGKAMKTGHSMDFRGYWQGHHRTLDPTIN